MKIIFVQPQGSGNVPLGLCYLASALEKEGYTDVEIIDLWDNSDLPNKSIKYFQKQLKKGPDVVAITSTTATVEDAIRLGVMARKYCGTIIYGGSHASMFQEQILKKVPVFDVLVYGEGDHNISEIMRRIEDNRSLKGINGVIYRENGAIKKNPPNKIIVDLDAIPFPAKHLLDLENYHAASLVLTSRGCPYKCTYCANISSGKAWRSRSPNNVVDEIELLLTDYPKIMKRMEWNVSIADENFNLHLKRAKQICDEIVKRKLDITLTFINGLHVKNIDIELMRKMKRAGCKELWYGIESGNEEILKCIRKNITKGMVRSAVKKARSAGIDTVGGHFMIGLDYDTLKTARETISFFKELKLDVAGFNMAIPLPYTELWNYVSREGRFLLDYEEVVNYSAFKPTNIVPVFETDIFTRDERILAYGEAIHALDAIIRKRALSPKTLFRAVRRFHSHRDVMKGLTRLNQVLFGKDIRRR